MIIIGGLSTLICNDSCQSGLWQVARLCILKLFVSWSYRVWNNSDPLQPPHFTADLSWSRLEMATSPQVMHLQLPLGELLCSVQVGSEALPTVINSYCCRQGSSSNIDSWKRLNIYGQRWSKIRLRFIYVDKRLLLITANPYKSMYLLYVVLYYIWRFWLHLLATSTKLLYIEETE